MVYVRDPKSLNGDIDNLQPDRVHRYYTILYEVDDKDSLGKWIDEEVSVRVSLNSGEMALVF